MVAGSKYTTATALRCTYLRKKKLVSVGLKWNFTCLKVVQQEGISTPQPSKHKVLESTLTVTDLRKIII